MGYYVTLTESNCHLVKEHTEEALARMRALTAPAGDESTPLTKGKPIIPLGWSVNNCKTANEVFHQLGFGTDNVDGTIWFLEYNDKSIYEEEFLHSIRDLLTGYMIWVGEDSTTWKTDYGNIGEQPKFYTGSIVWTEV
jgi:hypothetical protein